MRTRKWLVLVIGALIMVGCGKKESVTVSDAAGNKMTASGDGKVDIQGAGGERIRVESKPGGGGTVTSEDASGNKQQVTAASGLTEDEIGLPFYPGSQEKPDSSVKTQAGSTATFMSVRVTSDAPADVIAFYKPKLSQTNVISAGGNELLTGKLPDGASVQVSASREGGAKETLVQVLVTRQTK